MAEPATSFVIPVRNDATRLRSCLQAIAANDLPGGIEVVVADNGSLDESAAVAREMGAAVVELPGLKVAALRNRAAQIATGDILAFCDADNVVAPDWTRVAAELFAEPRVAVVGAQCDPPSPATWVQRAYDAMRDHRAGTHKVRWLGAGNMAVRRSVFLEVGGFDESLETCEDVDLCNRVRGRGHVLLADHRLRNVHLGDPATLSQLFRSELWRGRDNLRVSLRGGLALRDLPSIVIPVVDLGLLVLAACGLLLAPLGGLPLTAAAAATFLALAALRGGRMVAGERGLGLRRAPQAFAVAGTFDLARALALVRKSPYHRRQVAH